MKPIKPTKGETKKTIEPGQSPDVHRLTAAVFFNRPYDQVSKDQRKAAKAINYHRLYRRPSV